MRFLAWMAPMASSATHRGQVPAADQEHVETAASSRLNVLPGLPKADSPAQTVLAVGPWAADQAKHHCQGQSQDRVQDR